MTHFLALANLRAVHEVVEDLLALLVKLLLDESLEGLSWKATHVLLAALLALLFAFTRLFLFVGLVRIRGHIFVLVTLASFLDCILNGSLHEGGTNLLLNLSILLESFLRFDLLNDLTLLFLNFI